MVYSKKNLELSLRFFLTTSKWSTYNQQLVPNVPASFSKNHHWQPAMSREPIAFIFTSSAEKVILKLMGKMDVFCKYARSFMIMLVSNPVSASSKKSLPCTFNSAQLFYIFFPTNYTPHSFLVPTSISNNYPSSHFLFLLISNSLLSLPLLYGFHSYH